MSESWDVYAVNPVLAKIISDVGTGLKLFLFSGVVARRSGVRRYYRYFPAFWLHADAGAAQQQQQQQQPTSDTTASGQY